MILFYLSKILLCSIILTNKNLFAFHVVLMPEVLIGTDCNSAWMCNLNLRIKCKNATNCVLCFCCICTSFQACSCFGMLPCSTAISRGCFGSVAGTSNRVAQSCYSRISSISISSQHHPSDLFSSTAVHSNSTDYSEHYYIFLFSSILGGF